MAGRGAEAGQEGGIFANALPRGVVLVSKPKLCAALAQSPRCVSPNPDTLQ